MHVYDGRRPLRSCPSQVLALPGPSHMDIGLNCMLAVKAFHICPNEATVCDARARVPLGRPTEICFLYPQGAAVQSRLVARRFVSVVRF